MYHREARGRKSAEDRTAITVIIQYDVSGICVGVNGLHGLDFALRYDRRPRWDGGLIGLMRGGLASTDIGVRLGAGRVRRALRRVLPL